MSEDHTCGHDHAHEDGQGGEADHARDQNPACSCYGTEAETQAKAKARLELRHDAGIVLRRADQFLNAGKFDETHCMLSAAETLLDHAGGHDCPEGVWMFIVAGMLSCRQNDLEAAERWFHQGHQLSLTVNGEQHPSTGMALSNLGEIMTKNGKVAEAAELLTRAIAELKAAVPTDGFPADTIAAVIGYKQTVLDQLTAAVEPGGGTGG